MVRYLLVGLSGAALLAACGNSSNDRVCYVPSQPDGGCTVVRPCPSTPCQSGQAMTTEEYQRLGVTCAPVTNFCA